MIVVITAFINVDFGLLNSLWIVVPLLFVVLFLESVKGIRKYVRGYKLSKMLLHVGFVIVLGFSLTLIKYDHFNRLNKRGSVDFPYIETPKLQNAPIDYEEEYGYYEPYRIKIKKNGAGGLIYYLEQSKMPLSAILLEIGKQRYDHRMRDILVYAEADITYKNLKDFEWQFAYEDIYRIFYMTLIPGSGSTGSFMKNLYLTQEMFEGRKDEFPPPPYFAEEAYKKFEKLTVQVKEYLLNKDVETEKVSAYFAQHANNEKVFEFIITDNITLQQYMDFIRSYKLAIYSLRKDFDYVNQGLDPKERSATKFPMRYIERFE